MYEKTIEKQVRDFVKQKGGLCLKWVSPGYTGVPDRIILMPGGKIIFAEMKRPGESLRPRQKRVARILSHLGFTVIKVTCVEDLDGYI